MPFKLNAPVPYDNIKEMVKSYSSVMKRISRALDTIPGGPKLVLTDEPIGFYISADDLDRIKTTISTINNFDRYIGLFGIDPDRNSLTVCVVGVDSNGKILDSFKNGSVKVGEEKWPPTPQKLTIGENELDDFLNKI